MATSDLGSRTQFPEGTPASQKSTAELGGDLAPQMMSLVHHEIELAQADMAEKGKRAGFGVGMFGGAALMVAAVAQGAVSGFVTAATDRAGASGFEKATGVWPA
jgi:hypothetical protein